MSWNGPTSSSETKSAGAVEGAAGCAADGSGAATGVGAAGVGVGSESWEEGFVAPPESDAGSVFDEGVVGAGGEVEPVAGFWDASGPLEDAGSSPHPANASTPPARPHATILRRLIPQSSVICFAAVIGGSGDPAPPNHGRDRFERVPPIPPQAAGCLFRHTTADP
jgi:hypothetical protein